MEFLILFSPQFLLSVTVWRCPGNCMNAVKGGEGCWLDGGGERGDTPITLYYTNLTKSNHSLDDEASNKVARKGHTLTQLTECDTGQAGGQGWPEGRRRPGRPRPPPRCPRTWWPRGASWCSCPPPRSGWCPGEAAQWCWSGMAAISAQTHPRHPLPLRTRCPRCLHHHRHQCRSWSFLLSRIPHWHRSPRHQSTRGRCRRCRSTQSRWDILKIKCPLGNCSWVLK